MKKKLKKNNILLFIFFLLPFVYLNAQYKWELFSELKIGRNLFCAKAINSNEILIIGGYNNSDGILSSCEILDIKNRSTSFTTSMHIPRAYFVSLVTKDSNIIVISGATNGFSTLTPTVELFDIKTKEWVYLGDLKIPRWQHSAEFLNEDELIIVGGRHGNTVVMDDVEIFNIKTGQSKLMNPFPMKFSDGASGITSNGKLAFFGGRVYGVNSLRSKYLFLYDSLNDKWYYEDSVKTPFNLPSVIKLRDNRLLIAGGIFVDSPVDISDEIYIENNGRFNFSCLFPNPRFRYPISQLNNDSVILIGGYIDYNKCIEKCDWYNIRTNEASEGPSLNYARYNHCSVTMKDYRDTNYNIVLAIGGCNNQGQSLSSIEILENYGVYPSPVIHSVEWDCGSYAITAFDSLLIDEVVFKNPDDNINMNILQNLPADKVTVELTLKSKNKSSFFTIIFKNLRTNKSLIYSDTIAANPKIIKLLSHIEDGKIQLGSTKSGILNCIKLIIKNTNKSQFTLTDALLKRNIEFSIPQSQFPIILDSGEEKELEICYLPSVLTKQWDTLCIKDICDTTCFPINAIGDTVYYDGKSWCDVPITLKAIKPSQFFIVKAPYPNPTSSYLQVTIIENSENPTCCNLFDYMGNKIKELNANLVGKYYYEGIEYNQKEYAENLLDNSIGLYFLVIQNKSYKCIYPIILQ